MPQPQTVETPGRLEVASPVHADVRVAFAVLASAGAVLVSDLAIPDGTVLETVPSTSRDDADAIRPRFERFRDRGVGSVPPVPR